MADDEVFDAGGGGVVSGDDHARACGNAARTDSHARAARDYADSLDLRADHLPEPAGKRLRLTATRMRALADAHDVEALPATEVVA
ncbi:hypothetical protein [Nocardia sp. SYP-A9097]|uniref:hypothetical protein n=1 Tax=Nocardia sp. SYP-A9097 TaxID=2663237 RepID=UPI001E323B6C|nr:hypothetical protein [Nocardia sp. SYP-A9097]